MNDFFIYLLKSSLYLTVLYSLYWLLLRKETWFRVNRIFLLMSAVLALLLPLINVSVKAAIDLPLYTVWLNEVLVSPNELAGPPGEATNPFSWALSAYLAISGLLLLRLGFMVGKLIVIIKKGELQVRNGAKIIFTRQPVVPFSFLNWIVLNKNQSDDGHLQKIITHEKVHIRQGHTLDLVMMEIITLLMWLNPIVWLMKKSLKTQHEYLADSGTIESGYSRKEYLELLFGQTFGISYSFIAHNFNTSQIKNRLTMITKKRSPRTTLFKLLFTLPVIVLLVYVFSVSVTDHAIAKAETVFNANEKQIAVQQDEPKKQQQEEEIYTVAEDMPEFPGGDEARANFFSENVKYPEEAKKKGVEGRVFVSFVVEKDGSITGVKVLRGVGSGLDEEAVRVVSMMPKWKPGTHKGKTVRVQFNMPLSFELSKKSGNVSPPPKKKDK